VTGTTSRRHHLLTIFAIIVSAFLLSAPARAASEPFAANITCASIFTNVCSGNYTAPTDHRLVIEYLSFNCPASKTSAFGQFVIYSTGAGVTGYTAVTLPENAGGDFAQLGQTVKIYVDQKSLIVVTAALRTGNFRSSPPLGSDVPDTTCNVTLFGRQIPVSSGGS
jgi:hypothetical protein